jgi:hypothetical protein
MSRDTAFMYMVREAFHGSRIMRDVKIVNRKRIEEWYSI